MTTPTTLRPTGRRRKLALAAGFLALLCAPVLLWPLLRGGLRHHQLRKPHPGRLPRRGDRTLGLARRL